MTTAAEKIQRAIDVEVQKMNRSIMNIERAVEEGRIDPIEGGTRIGRAEQWCINRCRWITGNKEWSLEDLA